MWTGRNREWEAATKERIDCLWVSSCTIDCTQRVDEWRSYLASRFGAEVIVQAFMSSIAAGSPLNLLDIQFFLPLHPIETNKLWLDSIAPVTGLDVNGNQAWDTVLQILDVFCNKINYSLIRMI